MNFEHGILELKNKGLNIFLSAKVSDLPQNIFLFTENQKQKTLCLLGHGGRSLWENLPEHISKNPIDDFSIDQMKNFAQNVLNNDIEILFPDDQYLLPLQKLTRHFNFSSQSPIGLDISNEFGLWFAVRGVFLTSQNIPIIDILSPPVHCQNCHAKPCLESTDLIKARLACPVKSEHQYTPEQLAYHQQVLRCLKN